MYKELIVFRNELKNTKVPKYKLIGIISEILLSKELFQKNSDINSFLKDVFGISYKSYVMKSRTMIVARTSRMIHNSENAEYISYKKRLYYCMDKMIQELKKDSNKKEKNQFDGWLNNNEN